MTIHSQEEKDIERLRTALEDHLCWGVGSEWHSSMFTELSDKIYSNCQVMLSATTLKRFWGVINHDVKPSINTLDTLSKFIGFENWRAFRQSKTKKTKFSLSPNIQKKILYIGIGLFIAFTSIVLLSNNQFKPPVRDKNVEFSSRTLSNTYPNSVVFDFNLEQIESENIHIQQYWDVTKTIALRSDQKQATGIYYFPGYFRAKLMIDGQSVKEHDLFLKSNGWLGTINYQPVPKYFTPESKDTLALACPTLFYDEIRSSKEPLKTTFYYVNDLGNLSGDNFTLKASIKNTYNEKWAICQSTQIILKGTTGALIIPFSIPGCSSNNSLMLNDNYLNGKENDLSDFGTDITHYKEVKINVRNKNVRIFINEEEVYSNKYSKPMGLLVGLQFKFLGVGQVKSYTLEDQNGNLVHLN